MSTEIRVSRDPELISALRTAVAWLASEQPADALLTHHGISADRAFAGNVTVSFAPIAAEERPVFAFARNAEIGPDGELRNGFTPAEIDELRSMVAAVAPIADEWNGTPYCTYSVALATRAGRGVRGLIANYQAGCPAHGTSLCMAPGQGGCRWYADGVARVMRPVGWL